jgi:large repetitive protein
MKHGLKAGWLAFGLAVGVAGPALAGGLPVITGFSPTVGRPGDTVHVFGSGFASGALVRFNGRAAGGLTILGANQLDAVVPTNAATGPLSVSISSGTAISAAAFVVVAGAGPYLADFSPTLGQPGDAVSISGMNFTNLVAVLFNGVHAAFSVMGTSGQFTLLRATVPTGATTGPMAVLTSAGTNTTASDFVVPGPGPYIAGFSPDNGQAGTQVTLTGYNFSNVTAVRFNGTNAASFAAPAATQITARVPTGATTGPITVITPAGTNTSANLFVVGTAPLITAFAPTNGAPGSMVVINGANFLGTTAVDFNGINAPFVSVTAPTQITAQVPLGATTGPIAVAAPGGTNRSASSFLVLQPPVITGFTPDSGPPTTPVVLSGTNFVAATGVLFNGAGAAFTINSNTRLTASVPASAAAGPVPIAVVTPAGIAVSGDRFTITAPTQPSITGFSPSGGPVGTGVTILGSQFVNVIAVSLHGAPVGANVVSSTEIDITVPAGATTGPITVTTAAGTTTSTGSFTVGPLPAIDHFSPTNGVAGTVVVITGSNLLGATGVEFSGVAAAFTVDSPSQISVRVPAAAYPGPITVMTPTGVAISSDAFALDREADLALQASASPTPLILGQNLTNVFTLANLGPSDATGIRFVAVWPETARVISAVATQGTCARTTNQVTCDLSALPVGQGPSLTVIVARDSLGTLTNSASVSGNDADPNAGNNSIVETNSVVAPGLEFRLLPGPNLAVLWPVVATGFHLQVATNAWAPAAWHDSPDTAFLAGTNLTLTNIVSGSARYYRLRLPPP